MQPLRIDLPSSLTTIVSERLRRAILDAEFALGEALSEDRLAITLGVSRTPIREALTLLQMQGLVIVKPKRGTFVFRPSADDISDLCDYRLAMETQAVQRCFAINRAATLAAMRAAQLEMHSALAARKPLDSARADARFHDAIFANCGNHYFAEGYALASGRIATLRAHLSLPKLGEQPRAYNEHEAIIAAFAADDLQSVLSALTAHILHMRINYVQALNDGLFAPSEPLRDIMTGTA